ncbi:MAG: carbohydrate kinase [Bacillati bacterium ANGP1]|uniref:Carbohydrate kinase n=1 Tax=Candidatus Segetimicrobium genomatis TaxID=2569760 RepID=A0A537LI18_9BACT|nr:MAG: carbohydrate kinase [Terrabacteria group bacterium ANGP1]
MLSSGGARAVIVACGEALVDFTAERTERGPRYVPHVGGASLNVAVALARLGVAAAFLGGLSRDAFGQFLRAQLLHSGVDPRYISDRAEPTALAFVQQEGGREPEFSFYGHGTAERALRPHDLPPAFPPDVEALHFAGYSLLVEPVGTTLEALGRREEGRRLILLDPNVRMALTPDLDAGRARLETWVRRADVVKASRPDLGVLYPGVPAGEVARSWLARPDAPGPGSARAVGSGACDRYRGGRRRIFGGSAGMAVPGPSPDPRCGCAARVLRDRRRARARGPGRRPDLHTRGRRPAAPRRSGADASRIKRKVPRRSRNLIR